VTDANELFADWLDRELATVPHELAVRVRTALPDDWRSARSVDGVSMLTSAAAAELRRLLERGCETRWAAPGLLTVDALVTYACQLLARTDAEIESGMTELLDIMVQTMPQSGPVG